MVSCCHDHNLWTICTCKGTVMHSYSICAVISFPRLGKLHIVVESIMQKRADSMCFGIVCIKRCVQHLCLGSQVSSGGTPRACKESLHLLQVSYIIVHMYSNCSLIHISYALSSEALIYKHSMGARVSCWQSTSHERAPWRQAAKPKRV